MGNVTWLRGREVCEGGVGGRARRRLSCASRVLEGATGGERCRARCPLSGGGGGGCQMR